MFYKNSGRSTVLDRLESQRNDHQNAIEESDGDRALTDARRRSEQKAIANLSTFESELLRAWSQD
jgi:hypothetical protein